MTEIRIVFMVIPPCIYQYQDRLYLAYTPAHQQERERRHHMVLYTLKSFMQEGLDLNKGGNTGMRC